MARDPFTVRCAWRKCCCSHATSEGLATIIGCWPQVRGALSVKASATIICVRSRRALDVAANTLRREMLESEPQLSQQFFGNTQVFRARGQP